MPGLKNKKVNWICLDKFLDTVRNATSLEVYVLLPAYIHNLTPFFVQIVTSVAFCEDATVLQHHFAKAGTLTKLFSLAQKSMQAFEDTRQA